MMDMIQGGNRMVFVFRRHSEKNFLVFWFSFENFQFFFCWKGNFWFSIEGIISHCERVEKGKSVCSGAFLELHSFRFDRVVLTGHWHFS